MWKTKKIRGAMAICDDARAKVKCYNNKFAYKQKQTT